MAGHQPPNTRHTPWQRLIATRPVRRFRRRARHLDRLTLTQLAERLRLTIALLAAGHLGAGLGVWLLLQGSTPWLLLPTLFALAYLAATLLLRRVGEQFSARCHIGAASPLPWAQRTALLLALLILALVGGVYASLEGLLRSLHLPGTPAHGLEAATAILTPTQYVGRMREAVAGWGDFMASTLLTVPRDASIAWEHPLRIVFLLTFLDTLVIVPAYAIAGMLLVQLTERTIAPHSRLYTAWRSSRRWLRLALVVAILFDCLENLGTLLATAAFVAQHRLATVPAYRAVIGETVAATATALAEPLLWFAGASSLIKLLGLLALWAALATYWLIILNARRWPWLVEQATPSLGPRLWRLATRVRLPLILLTLIGLLLNVPQSNEIIRRWQTNWAEGVAALLAAALFALACGFYGWLTAPEEDSAVAPTAQPINSLLWFAPALALLAALSTALTLWQRGTFALGPWLVASVRAALPGIIVLIILPALNALVVNQVLRAREATSSAAPQPAPTPAPTAPLGVTIVPFLLAAAALAVVGLGAAQSATELIAYNALRGLFVWQNLALVLAAALLLGGALAVIVRIPDIAPPTDRRPWRTRMVGRARHTAARFARTAPARSPQWVRDWASREAIPRWRPVGVIIGLAALLAWGLLATLLLFVDRDMALLLGPVRALGTIALALLLFSGIVAALSALILLANDYAPYPVSLFNAIGMYRPPVLTLMLLWAYLGTSPTFGADVHRARLAPAPGVAPSHTPRTGLPLGTAFDHWLDDRCLRADQTATLPATDRPVVPIIFVAAEGGGIRAASWTAYVLRSAVGAEPEFASLCPAAAGMGRSDFLFALSGISGGSVGIATHTAYLLDPGQPADPATATTPRCADARQCPRVWVETALGADHLAPAVTWLLALEFPRLFLPVPINADRAAALERSVEQGWSAADLGDPRLFFSLCPATPGATCAPAAAHGRWDGQHPAIPLLLLNATSVESGCRFVATPLETNGRDHEEPVSRCIAPLPRDPQAGDGATPHGVLGATTDLVDLLCQDQDMPLSTAAFLSARWPYISPTGNLEGCAAVYPQGGGDQGRGYRPQTYLVDGGYLEGSGNATILSLYEALLPAIRDYNAAPNSRAVLLPVLLTIGNGYTEPSGPDLLQTPPQLTAPPATFGRIMNATSAVASQGADLRFTACDIFPRTPGQPAATCADRFDALCAAAGPTICTAQLQAAIDARCPNEADTTCILRHARFALQAHPGPRAELGWTLSRVAFSDFAEQYARLCGDTGAPGLLIDSWFVGLPRLATPPRTTCTNAEPRP